MFSFSRSSREEAASPMTTSAWGAAFSARSLEVTIPVESRTHSIFTSG